MSLRTAKDTTGGISGYAIVESVECGDPEIIWDKFKNDNPIFRKKEYQAFVEAKKDIVGIKCKNFESIMKISPKRFKKIIGTEDQIEDFGHLYISVNTINRFYEQISPNKPEINLEESDEREYSS